MAEITANPLASSDAPPEHLWNEAELAKLRLAPSRGEGPPFRSLKPGRQPHRHSCSCTSYVTFTKTHSEPHSLPQSEAACSAVGAVSTLPVQTLSINLPQELTDAGAQAWGQHTPWTQTSRSATTPGTARTSGMCRRCRRMAGGCQASQAVHQRTAAHRWPKQEHTQRCSREWQWQL